MAARSTGEVDRGLPRVPATSFSRIGTSALYVAATNACDAGVWGFAITRSLPADQELPAGPVALSDALTNPTWMGTLIYVASGPFPGVEDGGGAFLEQLRTFIGEASVGGSGALMFLPDGSLPQIDANTLKSYALLNRTTTPVSLSGPSPGLSIDLTGDGALTIQINPNAKLSVPPESGDRIAFHLDLDQPVITLDGTFVPSVQVPPCNGALLAVGGPSSGAYGFSLRVMQSTLLSKTNWGFQCMIPNASSAKVPGAGSPLPYLSAYLPFATAGPPQAVLGFAAQVNPVNPRNTIASAAPTVFRFDGTGTNLALASYFRTNYGRNISLRPVTDGSGRAAGLVVNDGYSVTPRQNGLHLAPVGDFVMAVDGATARTSHKLLCGLSGTETLHFLPDLPSAGQAGTRLRFVGNQAADVPQFPLQAASPVGPPLQPGVTLLGPSFETSYAAMVPPPQDPTRAAHYAAAPKGAELFGDGTQAPSGLLGPKEPGLSVQGTAVFPLLPFAAFVPGDGTQDMTATQLEQVEREILSPTRKAAIASAVGAVTAAAPEHSLFGAPQGLADGALVSTTTPTGFVTRYAEADGTWKQLLLSQVTDPAGGPNDVTQQMGFTGLTAELQSAFQTSDQFLVIANAANLGPFTPGSSPGPTTFMPPAAGPGTAAPGFFNQISIGSWNFAADTGVGNNYGDYHSVIIVKGVKGKILDVDPKTGAATASSLLRSPDKWTMRDTFATPGHAGTSELGTMSNWLVDYCLNAWEKRADPYFAKFASIIQDPDWTGVLILKATIAEVPTELAGILAGVKDPADFYAHHVGIEIGQIDRKAVQQTGTTSMFGLVYYVDPRYDDTQPPHTIAPADLGAPYDFTLLTLKALFENSAVKKFDSLAQMALNRLFGSAVSSMVDELPDGPQPNIYNTVLLEGGVQRNGDAVVYNLASRWPNRYALANNVLTSVEVDTAQMSTRSDSAGGAVVSWIAMSGFMNFAVIPAVPPSSGSAALPAFDLFSFGPDAGDDDAVRRGLVFNGLGLQITIPPKDQRGQQPPPVLELVEREIAFSVSASHPREAGIFTSFQLELLGLSSGDAAAPDERDRSDPASLGYLPAVTEYNLRGVKSGTGGWHGLNFKLNLGTPGALAGDVGLNSNLLVAWADDSGAADGSTTFDAFVGIELPGAGSGGDLFSLQTVIKLSVGLIQLMYVAPSDGSGGDPGTKGGWLLVLNEIALKLLGMLKIPPSGNTAFLLFGDPGVAGQAGLGWLAIYNQAKDKPDARAALISREGPSA